MLFLDDVYVVSESYAAPMFRRVPAPTTTQLQAVLQRISQRIGRHCEHCGSTVKIIADIEEPLVIQKILEHLERQARGPSFKHRAVRGCLRIRKQLRETATCGLEVLMRVDAEPSGLRRLKWVR
jgi:hypothetical protein